MTSLTFWAYDVVCGCAVSFQAHASLTPAVQQPQSSKSTGTKIKESITGAGDKIAREAQPDSSKTNTQSTMDKIGRSKDSKSSPCTNYT
ncbi:hypothetical protein G6011_10748 [Alternaria panax]|uniref:Uncharacterized protein n=1 Tax=Alternaria panax TaxID=48097 RepID=A0AAD4ICG9_9PLEO|nr:hypothetical protein G6011_10748 [Alternaria panax]